MDSDRSQLSITLPRNFMFHYRDAQPPRTPEPESKDDSQDLQPPPPPRQTFKVRRRRTTAIAANHAFDCINDERPIPTIEAPELHSDVSMDLPGLPSPVDSNLLSPVISFGRMLSPPKTPVSQMRGFSGLDDPQQWSDIDQSSQSESSSRPTSSSGFSDSSVSSRESFESFPSLGESCSSPEDDMMDPLVHFSPELKGQSLSSPFFIPRQSHPQRKLKLQATFTDEMDYHLWMTYLKYLQDPTVTPFKALPSTVPPNGVCHRVARMARKTWKGPRSSSCINIGRPMSQCASRCDTPDTIKPGKSGSCTPVPGSSKPFARFPTEKQCRKQLRDLAKQKPSLSAHYQRLVNHRSPSPFQSTPPEEQAPSSKAQTLSSPFSEEGVSFSTRDMNVSLATSTAASMQFGNPLSQLATENTPRPAPVWNHARSSAHQKSQSLHIGLGLGLGHVVGSSFSAMSEMTDASLSQHNSQTWHAPSARPPRLGSPLQLHAPRPIARPFKRRALLNFEDQVRNRGNSFVDQLFGAPAESSHRRVRSRGFSLGDMMEGARRARKSATNTTGCDPFVNTTPEMPKAAQRASVSFQTGASTGQGTIRLGSPFGARPSNTFPRASTTYGFEPAISFEQRLAALPSDPTQLSRS